MIVVADTSPLNYLIVIGRLDAVCRRLFTETTFRVTPELRAKFLR